MGLGPLMLDIQGTELTAEDERRLTHPLCGGVILFTRNYQTPEQLCELTAAIHSLRPSRLLIAVDHEGGKVQRFREGFTRLPPMRELGRLWDAHPHRARQLAVDAGYVLAAELRSCGVDFSFTPVLDVDHGASTVIGTRAFHHNTQAICELAHGLLMGLKEGGMAGVGKHFPGHGYIRADSHLELPVDERSYADIALCDLVPFRQMIGHGLAGMMPAHVLYPQVDRHPAGFSKVWLQKILRQELEFEGCIFSDDLSMEGAAVAGGVVERVQAALLAGCDMALVCNRPQAMDEVLAGLAWDMPAVSLARMARMHGRSPCDTRVKLHENGRYLKAAQEVGEIGVSNGELPLGG